MDNSVKHDDLSISSAPSIELEMIIGNLEVASKYIQEAVALLRKMANKKHEKRQKAIMKQK